MDEFRVQVPHISAEAATEFAACLWHAENFIILHVFAVNFIVQNAGNVTSLDVFTTVWFRTPFFSHATPRH
jgi:hypothetical protein